MDKCSFRSYCEINAIAFCLLVCMLVKLGPSHEREEYRMRLFKNRVMKMVFRPKNDELTAGYRTLHN
jgi:hypothetical protein